MAALCGLIHALVPFLLPFVMEDIVFERARPSDANRRPATRATARARPAGPTAHPTPTPRSVPPRAVGSLIKNRRRMRNQEKDNTFVNPDKLSDYFSDEYKRKFKEVRAAEAPAGTPPTVSSPTTLLLDRERMPVQMGPGEKRRYLTKSDRGL